MSTTLVELRFSAGEKSKLAPKSRATEENDSLRPLQSGVFTRPRSKRTPQGSRRKIHVRRILAVDDGIKHLVRRGHAAKDPVREIERPAINRDEGTMFTPNTWYGSPHPSSMIVTFQPFGVGQ